MNIKNRIVQSLRPRKDGVFLRSDVCSFGSASQVSVALNALLQEGALVKLDRGIYAKPQDLELVGKDALIERAIVKVAKQREGKRLSIRADKRNRRNRANVTASYVRRLAKKEGIVFTPTFADQWARAVTRLAGDDIRSDKIDDLLVALTRAGKLSPRDMTKLLIAHHRSQFGV
jgi:hypothetical protein